MNILDQFAGVSGVLGGVHESIESHPDGLELWKPVLSSVDGLPGGGGGPVVSR